MIAATPTAAPAATRPTPAAASPAPSPGRTLTINATPNPLPAGSGVLIYGQLVGSDVAGRTLVLYHRLASSRRFTIVQRTTTDAHGFYAFPRAEHAVETNRAWFVRAPGPLQSRTVHEQVAPRVGLDAGATLGLVGRRVRFTGAVAPGHRFERVLLQQQDSTDGTGWHTIARGHTNGRSRFAIAHAWRAPGLYTLRALFPADRRNAAGDSDTVTVAVQQAQVPGFTITSSKPVVGEGRSATIAGVLDRPGTTAPQPGTQVTLYGRQAGGRTEALSTTITGRDGGYRFPVSPVHNTVYDVALTVVPRRATARLFEGVQDVVSASRSSAAATDGGTVQVTGTVSPDKTGHAITLQQLGADHRWHDVAMARVTGGSRYALTYRFGQEGRAQLRARIDGGPDNVGAASTPVSVTATGAAPRGALPPAW